MKYWRVPAIWDDADCAILGGGPSLGVVPFDKLRAWTRARERRHVIAVNQAYKTGHWGVLFFGDVNWLEWNEDALLDWGGLVVTWRECYANRPWIRIAKCDRRDGLSDERGVLTWNRSSGACAISLAIALGAKRVVLFGFDGRPIDGRRNFHDDYCHGEAKPKEIHWGSLFPRGFAALAAKLPERGVEVVNATPGSVYTIFPIVDPWEILNRD